jgi:hypothetical protein
MAHVQWNELDFMPRTDDEGVTQWYLLLRRIVKHRPAHVAAALLVALREQMAPHSKKRAMFNWSVLARCALSGCLGSVWPAYLAHAPVRFGARDKTWLVPFYDDLITHVQPTDFADAFFPLCTRDLYGCF